MDSRTKFYGPVLAMLSLSAVAFNGFITPSIESEESNSGAEKPLEEVQPGSQQAEPNTVDSSETSSTTEDAPPTDNTTPAASLTDESTADSPPDPVTFLDWLFIPIPKEPAHTPAAE